MQIIPLYWLRANLSRKDSNVTNACTADNVLFNSFSRKADWEVQNYDGIIPTEMMAVE